MPSSLLVACALAFAASQDDVEAKSSIVALDRAVDGALFGVSRNALYRSRDAGRSWERLAQGTWLRDVLVSGDGGHALVFAHNETWLWRGGAELELVPLGERPLYHVSVRARAGDLWIATAFEVAEDEKTQEMLFTSDTTLAGPGFRALLFSSFDEGRSWRRIAEHEGAIVHAAWLGDGGLVRLCLSDKTIRGGTIDARDGTLVGGELELVCADLAYGGEWGTWLAFSDAQTGWVGGNLFMGKGARLARTSDGGRTWAGIETVSGGWNEAFRLGGGTCVRVHRGLRGDDRAELWRAGEFCEIRRFNTELKDVLIDAGGHLLVRLEDGEVWSLAADGGAWSQVGSVPVPR